MATLSLGAPFSKPGIEQRQKQPALLHASSSSVPKAAAPVTRVAIRDGKTIGINDHIYLSPAWAPGAGEPYMIARVMEFVTASSSRSGAATLASSSGTLQVRANLFLRMRDISLRSSNDPRLLVATMHSDVFSLENVRGICEVRHRDLIGSGTAPDVSQWKKKEDHFYYHQFYDRYIHRFYDVIPTEKVKNAPPEVLSTLRIRYSFVVAEAGMISDLCDALRGCATCHRWAASPESVRCDTCKKFFHMKCLNPPLASKPAKGYSWTCAPCSRRHEQGVGLALVTGGTFTSSSASSATLIPTPLPGSQGTIRGGHPNGGVVATSRGRGRPAGVSNRNALSGYDEVAGSSDLSPDASPAPEKTMDDVRGTRCFNRWPYRYFGQNTNAIDVLDPHDSVYPIATTRLGPKFQAALPSWQEQKHAGLGVHFGAKGKDKEDDPNPNTNTSGNGNGALATATTDDTGSAASSSKRKGRPPKRKRGDLLDRSDTPTTGSSTPRMTPATISSEPPEFERGTDQSVEPIFLPSTMAQSETILDAYLKSAKSHFKTIPDHNIDLIDRALAVFTQKQGDPIKALTRLSQSTPQELRIVHWTGKEMKQFENGIKVVNSDMKQLKKWIPTKKVADIVRYFVVWKMQRLGDDLGALATQGSTTASATGAVTGATAAATSTTVATGSRGGGSQSKSSLSTPSSWSNSGVSPPSRPSSTSRAVSPSLSVYGDGPPTGPLGNPASCAMCSTTSSSIWYKGPASLSNRVLCVHCGIYWRKYAAESFNTELVSINTRTKSSSSSSSITAATAGQDAKLGVVPPTKLTKMSSTSHVKSFPFGVSSTISPSTVATASSVTETKVIKLEPLKCVLCNRIEPKTKLAQCRQCSLSVHQGCYGLTDEELEMDPWFCEPCNNETTLDAALYPRCILCSSAVSEPVGFGCSSHSIVGKEKSSGRGRGRPKLSTTLSHSATTDHALSTKSSNGQITGAIKKEKESNGFSIPSLITATSTTTPISSTSTSSSGGGGDTSSSPLGALDVFKPTECNNWTHLLCAAWMPDVVFSDSTRLRIVEGCSNLSTWRYESVCCICSSSKGACIQCSHPGCKRLFHVSCAYSHSPLDYRFGFEILPLVTATATATSTTATTTSSKPVSSKPTTSFKPISSKPNSTSSLPIITFKGETGYMVPHISCQSHHHHLSPPPLSSSSTTTQPPQPPQPPQPLFYQFSELDSKSNQTLLLTFLKQYKTIKPLESFPLLRKSKRFDFKKSSSIIPPPPFSKFNSKSCFQCHCQVSPFWWTLEDQNNNMLVCNFCYHQRQQQPQQSKEPVVT